MVAHAKPLALLGAVLLSGCASTPPMTTWKAPDATPLEFRGHIVVAAVLVKDEATRRLAEDRLAQQIAVRGAQGRTLYSLVPGAAPSNEQQTRAALEAVGAKGIIVMRPISVDREVHVTEPYEGETYASFWGGYYGYGFSLSYSSPREATVSEKTTVYVETLVYSLAQNKLVWGARSTTTDPDTLAALIEELSAATTAELQKAGLIRKQ
ncbi:MAG TPA: hypothetical protein VKB34_17210 [Povalibacter sp.]|nr:hypothetical protein [Povalibacter sp.]